MRHLDTVGIDKFDALLRFGVVRGNDLLRPGGVEIERPLDDVVVMRADVGMTAAGIFAVIAPGGEMVVHPARTEDRTVGAHRRAAEPEVPIEARLHRLLRQVAPAAWPADPHRDG